MSQLCQTLQRAWVDAVVQTHLFVVYRFAKVGSLAQGTSSEGYFKASAIPFTRCGAGHVDGGNLRRIVVTACCYQLKLQTLLPLFTCGLVIRDNAFGPPRHRSADHGVSDHGAFVWPILLGLCIPG